VVESLAVPDGAQLLPADWLPRLRGCLLAQPDHRPEIWRLGGTATPATPAMRAALGGEPRHAAVLVPVIARGAHSSVLLTRRATQLTHHAGQISFPGGQVEPADADPLSAALRETSEEIGVAPQFVEPLGYLPDHLVLTGFRITPLVALVRPGFELRLDHSEVEAVFEIPLAIVMNPRSYRAAQRQLRGFEVNAHDLPFGEHLVWGATAGMLMTLCQLFAGTPA
jgi:8-oxo-dGTP pyrophosphatase MutT (NUDIX family)